MLLGTPSGTSTVLKRVREGAEKSSDGGKAHAQQEYIRSSPPLTLLRGHWGSFL